MNKVIIIATCKKYRMWLKDFLDSYDAPYPIILVNNDYGVNQFDARAVVEGIKGGYDEFLVLHDTIEIKNNKLFDIIFEEYDGQSVMITYPNSMFLVKYLKKDLDLLPQKHIEELFNVKDKWTAVLQECHFSKRYGVVANPVILFPDFDKAALNPHEDKYGRDNMILENEYLKKYKGSWDMPTLQKAKDYIPVGDVNE